MELSKNLKKILVTGAALLMTASVMGSGNVVNAKHRRYRYRTHLVYRRHARKHYRRAHKQYRRKARKGILRKGIYKNRSHVKYAWMADGGSHTAYYKVKILGYTKRDDEPYVQFLNKKQIKFDRSKTGYVPAYGLFHTRAEAVREENNTDPNVVDISLHDGSLEDTGKVNHHHKSHRSMNYKHNHNSVNSNVAQNLAEMKQQTLVDINNEREAHGASALSESPELDQIAAMRAKQTESIFAHKDPNTGINYYAEDAQKLGYDNVPNKTLSENIAEEPLGKVKTSYSLYTNRNGIDTANHANDGMMNHDGPSWGHRKNILKPTQRLIGVGTAQNNGKYYVTEDFAGTSSEIQD